MPLGDDQTKRFRQALSQATNKKAEIETHIEKSLLAGVVVRIGSQVYDASFRTQIARLAERMRT